MNREGKNPEVLLATAPQRVLEMMARHAGEAFYDLQVSHKSGVSRGATNLALHRLARSGLLVAERKGRMRFYRVNLRHAVARQFKTLLTVLDIWPLVEQLSHVETSLVVLFGSSQRGTDTAASDVDLFVMTNHQAAVRAIVERFKSSRPIRPVIFTPTGWAQQRRVNPEFFQDVQRGLILWEAEGER